MSVVNSVIIEAQTEAADSAKFLTIGTGTIMASPLGEDETITLQQTHDGSTWQTVKLNGVEQTIDANHNQLTISGPGQYRVRKSVTAELVGVTLWKTEAN